jgi:hypothetical protein
VSCLLIFKNRNGKINKKKVKKEGKRTEITGSEERTEKCSNSAEDRIYTELLHSI